MTHKKPAAESRPRERLRKDFFDRYDGERTYEESFEVYFDAPYTAGAIRRVWGARPPYRLLDSGSASGLTILEFAKLGIEAWGVENNVHIHGQTPAKLRRRNLHADVRALPFEDGFFDFVYDTCLCHVPPRDVGRAIGELHRVTRRGVYFGAVVADMDPDTLAKHDLLDGLSTVLTLREWSKHFLRGGFRLAITDSRTLARAWRHEVEANKRGDQWYTSPASYRYCFYTKA